MEKSRILLTGGTGMVGRNFLEHADRGACEILTPGHAELDLLCYENVRRYLRDTRPGLIIHAAGRVGGIQANIRHPLSYFLDNWDMGRNIVYAAYETGVRNLINIGSSCMYPCRGQNPLREEMILNGELEPTNEGYALAKIGVMRLCRYIMREHAGYCFKTVIPCNLYGRWDKFDPLNSHLLPAIIEKIHSATEKGEEEVVIWGDGKARREFMYAADFADGLWHAVRHFKSLPDVMNIGLGYDYSVDEYYRAAARVIGYKGRFRHDLTKPVGMAQKVVDVSKQQQWGWRHKTDLYTGLKQTYDFYLQHRRPGNNETHIQRKDGSM